MLERHDTKIAHPVPRNIGCTYGGRYCTVCLHTNLIHLTPHILLRHVSDCWIISLIFLRLFLHRKHKLIHWCVIGLFVACVFAARVSTYSTHFRNTGNEFFGDS